jgi:hypothetical protein
MWKYDIRDAVIKPRRWSAAYLVIRISADQSCAVFESHGTLMKRVGSTEQRTSRRNAATLLQRENLREVDFFCARRLHQAVIDAGMEIVEIGSPGSPRSCTGDQFSSPHCRLSKVTSNLVFRQPNGALIPTTTWRILHGHGEFSASPLHPTAMMLPSFFVVAFVLLPLFLFCCLCFCFVAFVFVC